MKFNMCAVSAYKHYEKTFGMILLEVLSVEERACVRLLPDPCGHVHFYPIFYLWFTQGFEISDDAYVLIYWIIVAYANNIYSYINNFTYNTLLLDIDISQYKA